MYIARFLLIAVLVTFAYASCEPKKHSMEDAATNAYCICDNGDTGVAWFGGCHAGYAYCGNNGPPLTVCCKKI